MFNRITRPVYCVVALSIFGGAAMAQHKEASPKTDAATKKSAAMDCCAPKKSIAVKKAAVVKTSAKMDCCADKSAVAKKTTSTKKAHATKKVAVSFKTAGDEMDCCKETGHGKPVKVLKQEECCKEKPTAKGTSSPVKSNTAAK